MDDETAALIFEIQLADSIELGKMCDRKGKGREGDPTDSQLAFQIYTEDLKRNATIVADKKMTKSIARACQTDGEVLITALSQEQTAIGDREVACRLGGVVKPTPAVELWTVTSEFLEEEMLGKMKALYVEAPTGNADLDIETGALVPYAKNDEAESSKWAAARTSKTKLSYKLCEACQEDIRFYDVARAPCGHEYCRNCLQDLFRASLTDDCLFPPRCCRQPIITCTVRIFLTAELVQKYEEKKIEYDTPDRTYCSNPSCSVFIRAQRIAEDRATCSVCSRVTCTICKGVAHEGDCPADVALQQVLATATENGWQRCYGCKRLVELNFGSALVENNSATSVEIVGRHVDANSGMRIDYLQEPTKSLHVNQLKLMCRNGKLELLLLLKTLGLGTTVITRGGITSGDSINVKSEGIKSHPPFCLTKVQFSFRFNEVIVTSKPEINDEIFISILDWYRVLYFERPFDET
ncbi:hypothetical protein G7Y89_g1025 [Cudoniella acicularis]|uniref:RING-type domain-containing protein n=1 Tax=Cudoniella acicularis TaxID=354080 RepID=A0A8H4RXR1_9HELO|nr:hypothetical protein G7Y89_g1025 [Cudoniella acicularis]